MSREEHYFQEGIPCHRYSFDHHPGLEDNQGRNQEGQGRLAKLFKKVIKGGSGPNRDLFMEKALSQFRADEVHLYDEALLDRAAKLAADWGAELKKAEEGSVNRASD